MDNISLEQQLVQLNQRMAKVERYMLLSSLLGVARVLLILVPIVLAFIFIPPFIKENLPFVTDLVSFVQDLMSRSKGIR